VQVVSIDCVINSAAVNFTENTCFTSHRAATLHPAPPPVQWLHCSRQKHTLAKF